jgi:hypothetical protein
MLEFTFLHTLPDASAFSPPPFLSPPERFTNGKLEIFPAHFPHTLGKCIAAKRDILMQQKAEGENLKWNSEMSCEIFMVFSENLSSFRVSCAFHLLPSAVSLLDPFSVLAWSPILREGKRVLQPLNFNRFCSKHLT